MSHIKLPEVNIRRKENCSDMHTIVVLKFLKNYNQKYKLLDLCIIYALYIDPNCHKRGKFHE